MKEKQIYIFNPDNDLSLANFGEYYTPPKAALKIGHDLDVLPIWFAEGDTSVVCSTDKNEAFVKEVSQHFSLPTSLVSFREIALHEGSIVPWGWNPALRRQLIDAGVCQEQLPAMGYLKQLRQNSSRQNAVEMLKELKKARDDVFCGESYFFTHIGELTNYLTTRPTPVLKMPNSGSGKGLVWIKEKITDKQIDWAKRVIREQGGVVAEPVLDKTIDFAMEFFANNGRVSFSGYSLFESMPSGAYRGNTLLPDDKIEHILSAHTSKDTLQWLKVFYLEKLAEYFPLHQGYIGVDMMICNTPEGYRIQPCVEMNLRMNMGMVARIFYDRFAANNTQGKYIVDFFRNKSEALNTHREMQSKFPPVVKNGRVESGYLSLTPVREDTNYVAYILMEKGK